MQRFFVLAFLLACVFPSVTNADELADARTLSSQLVQELGAALKKEMSAGGPAQAVTVCRDLAPSIAGELSRSSGARVSRVSLKIRNPALGTPDAWEQAVLLEFERRLAAGEKAESLEYSETTTEPAGQYFRYMKALAIQPLCLSCHGSVESIPEGVKAELAAHYPRDQATGYLPGAIRGAVTIKAPAAGKP
ncbi:MAG TPA: DUF3365 domain-containing protein [Burkholderiales bacterium]|nr:DUF3365 domain-containing protein [Burkholderiales bacterium]